MDEDLSEQPTEAPPREIKLEKGSHGFGFNIRGQVSEGGQLKSIGGVLYAPMQYISAVLEGGPANQAGINVGDRVLEVNGVQVEGSDHQSVVQLIKRSGNVVSLTILSVSDEERAKLEVDSTPNPSSVEYYERRSVPLSIPNSDKKTDEYGKEYVVFNIHLASKLTAQRRYREFDALHVNLKRQFSDFLFPKLPTKWPFALSASQVDTRRRGLEDYMEKVCGIKVIFESDLVQDFLCVPNQVPASPAATAVRPVSPPQEAKKEVNVTLPGGKICRVFVPKQSPTPVVYQAVAKEIGLSENYMQFYSLFKMHDNNLYSKLESREFPHQISQSLSLRKWLFSTAHEKRIIQKDSLSCELIFLQAVEEINQRKIDIGSYTQELQSLRLQGKQAEFLSVMASLPSYNSVSFPHCKCDARKDGHIRVVVSLSHIKLQACDTDGTSQDQEHSFPWEMVQDHEADLEEEAFIFRYDREGKSPKLVRVFSKHYLFMEECVSRAIEESHWPLPSSAKEKKSAAIVNTVSNHVKPVSYEPDDEEL